MGEARRQALRIGSLLFCPACGTLLDLPKDEQDEIECHSCGRREPASCKLVRLCQIVIKLIWVAYENLPTTTYSSPQAFPSSLRSKRALVQNTTTEEQAAKSKDTIVSHCAMNLGQSLLWQSDESCPKCSKQGLSYYTMQLRSADEGSTVFYEVSSWQGTLDLSLYINWQAVSRMWLQILSKQLVSTSAIVVTYHRIACIIQYPLRLGGRISPPSSCSHLLPYLLRFWHSLPLIGNWQSSSMLDNSIASNYMTSLV